MGVYSLKLKVSTDLFEWNGWVEWVRWIKDDSLNVRFVYISVNKSKHCPTQKNTQPQTSKYWHKHEFCLCIGYSVFAEHIQTLLKIEFMQNLNTLKLSKFDDVNTFELCVLCVFEEHFETKILCETNPFIKCHLQRLLCVFCIKKHNIHIEFKTLQKVCIKCTAIYGRGKSIARAMHCIDHKMFPRF